MKQRLSFIVNLAMVLGILSLSTFAQNERATAAEVKSEEGAFGGKVVVTVNGKKQQISDDALDAWLVSGGKEVVYSGKDGSGGYENEGQSLHIYNVATGKTRKIMSEYSMVIGLSEKKLSNGQIVLLVKMADGGLGGAYFAVVDPKRGQVLSRSFAELSAIKGDFITLSFYEENDWEKISEERGVDEYKNRTAFVAKTKVKPSKTEKLDLKKVLKNKVIINKNSFEIYESKIRKVKLYFWRFNDNDGSKPFVLGTVEREVDAKAPLTPTLEGLFRGTTKEEEDKGLGSSVFGMKFEGVVMKNGVATVKFSQPKDQTNYGSLGPFIFLDAIEKTAKQFPTVNKVVVCAIGETLIDAQMEKQFPRCK